MAVAAEDPNHLEARLRLANVLEEQGKKAEALEIVTDGKFSWLIPRSGPDSSTSSTSSTRFRIPITTQSL